MSTITFSVVNHWFNLPVWKKIVWSILSGALLGLLLGKHAFYLKPIGNLFINSIKMMALPIIFISIICAILTVNDTNKMQRAGIKALLLYGASMTTATVLSLIVATWIAPGKGLKLSKTADLSLDKMSNWSDLISSLIPSNLFNAFSNANIFQILISAILIGISIHLAGEAALAVKKFFQALSAVVFKFCALVMGFAPYGIFALMATTTGEYGSEALFPLIKLILSGYVSCFLLILIFYSASLLLLQLNPIRFFKHSANALAIAFTSSSSTATLPVSVRCAEENLGVSNIMARFLLPLGTAFNLNGLAVYLSITTVFAANIYEISLGMTQYATLIITIVLTSMGAGGMPGSALIVMGAVMSAVDLPLGAIPLIAGIDRIIDMGMTTTNVIGDLFTTVVVAKSENELDHSIYSQKAPC